MNEHDFLKLQNGSDIRGVALEGVDGEHVNLTKVFLAKNLLLFGATAVYGGRGTAGIKPYE